MKSKKQKVIFKYRIITIVFILLMFFLFRSAGKIAILLDSPTVLNFLVKTHVVDPTYLWDGLTLLNDITPRYSYVSFAIEHDSRKTFEKLLSLGAISLANENFQEASRRALLEATFQEDVYWIRELGKVGVDLNSEWSGYPIFFNAVDNVSILEYYLDNGVDVNRLSYLDDSAIYHAVLKSKFDAVYLLLNHGASVSDCQIWTYTNNAPDRGIDVVTSYGRNAIPWDNNSQMEVMRQKVLTHLYKLGFQTRCHEIKKLTTLNFQEKDLVGVWTQSLADPNDPECKNAKPDDVCIPNDSQELNFSIEDEGNNSSIAVHTLNSYLHHRPDLSGLYWHLEGDTAYLENGDGSQVGSFKVLSLSSTTLSIDSDGIPLSGIYKRIK